MNWVVLRASFKSYAIAVVAMLATGFAFPHHVRGETGIDGLLAKAHAKAGIGSNGRCDDATFFRRLSLDLVGRVPSTDELLSFLASPDRSLAVDRMLETSEHARFWSQLWTVMLVGRGEQRGVEPEVLRRWLEGEHSRATELLHTGFSPVPSFPRPALGAVVSSKHADPGFPRYVTLGGNGFGPAFLGSEHGPFVIEDIDAAKTQLGRVIEKQRSMDLLSELNSRYASTLHSPTMEARTAQVESVRALLSTPFPRALDLKSISDSDRERYGDHTFGNRVLAARELLKLGVPFVEAQLPGWDTHIDNQNRTNDLCEQLEKPWLALMDDLQAANLWDDTLLVWMGEFGRTPTLNGRAGRDHFPEATPVVLAGGNLGGRVIGETNQSGTKRVGETHSVGDLMATLMTLLGVDIDEAYTTDFGSPTTITDDGTPIASLLTS